MSGNDDQGQSPFTRPGFVVATGVVAVLAVVAVVLAVLAIRDGGRDEPTASPDPSTTTAPSTSSAPADGDASICGLSGEVTSGTVKKAPAAEWKYEGTIAYPTSAKYGPGTTDDNGVRSCFQHSPEGALFMTSSAVAQGSNPETAKAWIEYALADGPGRDELLADGGEVTSSEGVRLQITGFRMLNYDGKTASVDMAIEGTSEGQTVTMSAVYSLVWQDGDWKLAADSSSEPVDFATIDDTSGYAKWGNTDG